MALHSSRLPFPEIDMMVLWVDVVAAPQILAKSHAPTTGDASPDVQWVKHHFYPNRFSGRCQQWSKPWLASATSRSMP
jgi:hypothetical protein